MDTTFSDITPILNLSNLTSLGLGRNQISEIDSLSKLSHLKELYIDSNSKGYIGYNEIANLTYFDASDNLIETLPPLTHLNNGWWRIYLSDNYISDITPINGVTANKIVLSGNCIEQPLGFTLYDWAI